MEEMIYLVPLFFLTALVYSTAGFAGGSTYLAILLLFHFPYDQVPKIALVCNLIVSAGGCYFFMKEGHFSARKILPFIVTSLPAAYLGGRIPVEKNLFVILLACSLLVAGLRMLIAEKSFIGRKEVSRRLSIVVGLPGGVVLGGLAGLTGIGGGIFISPLLLLFGWANAKEAAAAASFFIFVNSFSGLLGQMTKNHTTFSIGLVLPLALAVFAGGQIGSRLGSGRISKLVLQRVTAVLILFASGRLFWGLLLGGPG